MENMKYMISENIKNFKEVNDLSLRECADFFKINHVIVYELISKKRTTARLDVICKLANALNVKLDDLLFSNISENNLSIISNNERRS